MREVDKYKELANLVELHILENQTLLIEKLLASESFDEFEYMENSNEVYEWWLVDRWLLIQLKKRGEVVIENDYGFWWSRGCTGQAIKLDSVIEEIYEQEVKNG